MTQPPPYGHGYPPQPPPYGGPPYPYPGPAAPDGRWWQHPALVVATLVVFPPGGVALVWLTRWARTKKIIATVLACLWFITPFLGDQPTDPKAGAGPKNAVAAAPPQAGPPSFIGENLKTAQAEARKAGYSTKSHDASDGDAGQWADGNWKVCFQSVSTGKAIDFGVVRNEWPCPAKDGEAIPYPKMPKVTGLTFAKASETLVPLALGKVEVDSAYTNVTLPAAVDEWSVCFQDPPDGKEIKDPKSTTAGLKLTAPGTACPETEFTQLPPAPTPPAPTPPVPTPPAAGGDSANGSSSGGASSTGGSSTSGGNSSPDSSSTSGSSSTGGSSTSGGAGSTYYKNCTAVRAAGKAPIHRDDPGYGPHLDRDGDGVGCE